MSRSDLENRHVSSISVCGKLLRKGQTVLISEDAVGPRERRQERRGRIKILPSNKPGKVRIRAV